MSVPDRVALAPKTSGCWVCGVDNPAGLHVPFEADGDNGSRAIYTAREHHAGWPGMLHGGLSLALMDEAFGWALYFHGLAGVTARFEARYREAIQIGDVVSVRAWTTSRRRHLVQAKAEIRRVDRPSALMVEAEASMFVREVGAARTLD